MKFRLYYNNFKHPSFRWITKQDKMNDMMYGGYTSISAIKYFFYGGNTNAF